MSGLFSTFNIAKRGMNVQQKAIDVTSHNIANANTNGYSRQTVKIETTTPFSMPSINNAAEPGQLGTGSQVSAIERVRDEFLDYQVRVETSTKGQYDTRQTYLSEIENIVNEPSDTGISTLLGKFFDSWQQLSKQPQSSNARTVVAQQSAALADELNHTYTQFSKLRDNALSAVKDTVFQVNDILNQINELNKQIVGVNVAGQTPNDLLDKRDTLIDELSSKFNVNVDKKAFDGINLSPADTNGLKVPQMINAERGSEGLRLSYINSIEKDNTDPSGMVYKVTYYKYGDMSSENNRMTVTIRNVNEDNLKQMQQNRVIWAASDGSIAKGDGSSTKDGDSINFAEFNLFQPSSGEMKGYVSIQKDIDDYMDQLNKLAKAVAFSVNAVHSGMSDVKSNSNPSKDYMPFFVNSDTAQYSSSNNTMTNLDDILNSEKDITAGNISVNKELLSDVMKIKTRTHDNEFKYEADNNVDGETDGARALAIAQLRDSLIKVQDIGSVVNERKDMFDTTKGGNILQNNGLEILGNTNGMKIDSYYKDTVDRLGVQAQEAKRIVKNQESLLQSFEESKASVSGVSLDEEMANLIQYQHAYQANAKIIATVDELLDVVVNGLKK